MIPPFILSLVEGMLGPSFAKFAKPLIYALAIVVLVAGFGIAKCSYDRHIIADHEAATVQRAKPATDQAATERASETTTLSNQEQEMHNVIAAEPDQPIAPTSHARACLQLQRAGRHSPACAGPSGGH